MLHIIRQIQQDGLSRLETLTEQDLVNILTEATRLYSQGEPVMTDAEYDLVRDYLEAKNPQHPFLKQVGSSVAQEKNKAVLPFEMASMNKIKPDTDALMGWKTRFLGPYVISAKLDGVSGLYSHIYDGSDTHRGPQLFTRGDGKVGQNISHFINLLHLPPIPLGTAVRGEFILPKATFQSKYSAQFANARNLVSGIINSKQLIPDRVKDLHFVVYEVVSPAMPQEQQVAWAAANGFRVVRHHLADSMRLTNENLSQMLVEWRNTYEYEMDGLVITDNRVYPRVSGNPEHAFAFKMAMNDNSAEVKVVDVLWSPSKDGYLKPRVRIEPVRLSGTTIEYATGFNAKFIQDNCIGVGAVIRITRSGDVIPFIQGVVVPAERAKMPPTDLGECIWTSSGVDLVLKDASLNRSVMEKNITAFFTHFKVDSLSAGNVAKLYGAGYNTVAKILNMSVNDFMKVDGFQQTLSKKIHGSIRERLAQSTLLDWLIASHQFGRGLGEKRLKLIVQTFPEMALPSTTLSSTLSDEDQIHLLMTIPGIGRDNAVEFVRGLPAFHAFLGECNRYSFTEAAPIPPTLSVSQKENPLFQKKIVMSKIRDKYVLGEMEKRGATLEDHVHKNTFALVVKSKNETSNKIRDAQKFGIPIYEPEEFASLFFHS